MSEELNDSVALAMHKVMRMAHETAAELAEAAIEAVRAFDARREPVLSEPDHGQVDVEGAPPADADQVEAEGHAKLRAIAEVNRVARAMREADSAAAQGEQAWNELRETDRAYYRMNARWFLAGLHAVGLNPAALQELADAAMFASYPPMRVAAGLIDAELDQAVKSNGTAHVVRNVHVAPRRPDVAAPDMPPGAVAKMIEKLRGPSTSEADVYIAADLMERMLATMLMLNQDLNKNGLGLYARPLRQWLTLEAKT